MKKINYLFSALTVGVLLLSSCSKSDDEDAMTPTSADMTITLNTVSNPSEDRDTLLIKRSQSSVVLKSNAITSTSTDLRRVYVYKKSYTVADMNPDYDNYGEGVSGFKKDGNNNWYYDIPTEERNNTSLTLTVPTTVAQTNSNSVGDEYAFYYTGNVAFDQATDDPIAGPAQFFIIFGKVDETTGYKIYNFDGPNPAAFDLRSLVNKSDTDPASDKDIADGGYDDESLEFEGTLTSLNETRFITAPENFDYANATDISIQAAYTTAAGNILTLPVQTTTEVALGRVYIARIRGGSGRTDYAAIRITGYVEETDPAQTGSGKNNEYIEFSVKKP